MKVKKLNLIIILLLISISLSAAGKKEVGEYTSVEGLKTWGAAEDISELPDGKYNIIVKGEDTAGNIEIAGPYNVIISAESDLTTVSIANPVTDMIVTDNLNIVGDAFDDDGVERVELKLDDGFYQKCEGTAFWNYYLNLDKMTEGPHTITVRGTDINGLEGIEKSVNFTVDKEPPVITIVSHQQGSVLAGKIKIIGELTDAGGIEQLAFSEDGQADFKKIKVSYNKKMKIWEFSQTINTNKMEDGTYNYWYKSVDSAGAEGVYSFLFFVDNNSPELTVIEPQDGAVVHESIGFSGKISDTVRVKSLTIKIGSEVHDIKLLPGNPYWAIDIDLPDDAARKLSVEFEAEDFAGNITKKKIKLNNNAAFDLPMLTLSVPKKIGVLQKIITVGIAISDDDKVKGFEYFLDQNEPVFVETRGTSVLSFSDLAPGKHILKIIPFDENETQGKTVSSSFVVPKVSAREPELPAPVITIEDPVSGFVISEGHTVSGKVLSEAGLAGFEFTVIGDQELVWTSVIVDSSGIFTVDILSSLLKEGNNIITFRAVDRAENKSTSHVSLTKDSLAPKLLLLTPVKDDTVNGKITVSGKVSDISPVFRYEFSLNGSDYIDKGSSKFFSFDFDYSLYEEKPDILYFRTSDENRNVKEFSFPFTVNSAVGIPVVSIQFPLENSTIRGKASISGTALDDDGIKALYYAFNSGKFSKLEGSSTFNIPVPFSELEDSKNFVQIKAEDLNGVFSEVLTRNFVVSRAGPVIKVAIPTPETYINGSYQIKGTAYDSNGIDQISISIDNGNSYTIAEGEEEWSYLLDTLLLHDGTHSLYVKALDKAGTQSFYTTIINIDNTSPVIKLDKPENSSELGNFISFDGRVTDNTLLKSLILEIQPLGKKEEGQASIIIKLDPETIIHHEVKTNDFIPGWYNIRLEAVDGAGNISNETRSIRIKSPEERGKISIIYPLEGESYNAFIKIEGVVDADILPDSVIIIIDETVAGTAEVNETGYFNFLLDGSIVSTGTHRIEVQSVEVNSELNSPLRMFLFNNTGPWLLFNQSYGDFLTSRTYIMGTLGYETEDGIDPPKVKNLMISYDNGRSFMSVKAEFKWKARIETELFPDGDLSVLAKVIYEDNTSSVVKMTLGVDKTPPDVVLENSLEGESFNDLIILQGSAYDNSGIRSISYLLREGDKSSYEVPSFIQGLYLDFHSLGATYGEIGAGLTFFDDNVKLQASVGLSPPGRFSGLVLAGKLLANVAAVPYSFLFGPDWQNFSMAFTIGADFSYFSMSDTNISFTSEGVVLGSVLGQWEFIRYSVPDLRMFNTYSLYVEASVWFISSDIQAGVVPTYSIGTRIGIF